MPLHLRSKRAISFCSNAANRIFALVAGVVALLATSAAQPSADGRTPVVISSIRQFWDVLPEHRAIPHEFQLECTVTFIDPVWRILFVQDSLGESGYAEIGSNPFPVKTGQRLLVTGNIGSSWENLSFAHAKIASLGFAPVVPLPVARSISDHVEYAAKYVEVSGLVVSTRRLDPEHLQINLSVEGIAVTAWIQVMPGDATPDWQDAILRIAGVYNPKVESDGKLTALELMVPDLSHVTVVNRLADDPRFLTPVISIASLPRMPADRPVRIVGRVRAQEPGRSIQIRDDTGQVDILSAQTRPCSLNETIEAIGYPSIHGTEWRLAAGLFRTVLDPVLAIPAHADQGRIHLAAQVLELSPQQAQAATNVRLTGIVTWSHRSAPFFFIQDPSGGVRIRRGSPDSPLRAPPGRMIEAEGVTGMGAFAPEVAASRYEKISDSVLPEARRISLEHALTGVEEGRWVEMRGYLRQVRRAGGWNRLEVVTTGGDFVALLPLDEEVPAMVGAVIRLHGVCTATADSRRKLTGIELWVPAASYVQIEESAPEDPFALPTRSLASLGQFDTLQSFNRRQKVTGVVLHHEPGHVLYLEDQGESLVVFAREGEPLAPGDRVEVAGFYRRQAARVTMREAVYRKVATGPPPNPLAIEPDESSNLEYDGRLVRITGLLLEESTTRTQLQLTVQSPSRILFEAHLHGQDLGSASVYSVGSELALTGIYEINFDEYGRPASFQLRLRSPADIVVLRTPTWFNPTRVLTITAALVVGILLFIGWVVALRRRVQRQTEQIREQLKRESLLESELQRVGKIESLGLLAGGIAHDFNNLLTVVSGNISFARMDPAMSADAVFSLTEAGKGVVRARDLTQQLLTFAKGGAPVRAAVLLPDVVREVAEFALRGSNSRCQFDIPEDLWPANVDKGQIGQVMQNLAINGLQSMPDGGVLEISLRNARVGDEFDQLLAPGRYLLLSVTDHGKGIAAADLPHIFDPYYSTKQHGSGLGLATVHSIVKRHLGRIAVDSVAGQGTVFRIWLPAADAMPELTAAPAPNGKHLPTTPPARVLFMDDEDAIRRLGTTLLRRLGHDPVAVADGADALREYAAAQAEGRPFRLVILDLTIPGGIGGRQTIEELRKLDPAVVALVSSGYSSDAVLANFRAFGFSGLISKPYEIADFAREVAQALDRRPVPVPEA